MSRHGIFYGARRGRSLRAAICFFITCLIFGLPALCASSALAPIAAGGGAQSLNQHKAGIVTSKIIKFPQLNIREAIEFNRTQSDFTLHFPFPDHWHLQPGSLLILSLSHSPALLPMMSNLRIDLNGIPLRNVTLDQQNAEAANIAIPLDKADLKEWNEIKFRISQHYSTECEDDASSSLWTRIGPSSRIVFNIKQDSPELNLQNWPYPVIDIRAAIKEKVYFAPTSHADSSTLQAMARIAASLGSLADSQKLEIAKAPNAEANNIFVGTPIENPAIAALASKLTLPINATGKFVDQSGVQIPDDAGVLELVSNEQGQVTLIVSGNSPQGVNKAASALTEDEVNPILGGQAAIVEKIDLPEGGALSVRPNQMPEETSFTLADLGYATQTVHGSCPEPIKVDCNTIAGIQAIGDNQKIRIVYGYGAQLNTDLSSLEVKLNGVSLRSYSLDQKTGEEHHIDMMIVPNYLFNPENRLEFNFHLYPKLFGHCVPKNDEHLWGTLYEDTRIIVDREYVVSMPDLSLLNDMGYPYVNNNGVSDLSIVIPADAAPGTVLSLVNLSFLLGQWAQGAQSQISVVYDNAVTDDIKKKNNLIIFSPNGQNALQKALVKNLTLNDQERLFKIFNFQSKKHLTVKEIEANGYIEAIISPWNSDKNILVLSGSSKQAFTLAIAALTDSSLRYKLAGSLASISAEGIVKHSQASIPIIKSKIAPWRLVTLWLSQYAWLGPFLLAALLVLLVPRLLKAVRPD